MWMKNLISTCFFHVKEIVKNQFDNHLLVKMVLRVDEFFIIFFPVYHIDI